MEYRRCASRSFTLLSLLGLVCCASAECPTSKCAKGLILQACQCVACPKNHYWLERRRVPLCELCTNCSATPNLTQVLDCGPMQNRKCHCEKGFFCESPAQFTCRRCKPCPPGTFSSGPTLGKTCQSYTDCGSLGLAVLAEGTRTEDRVCASVSNPTPNTAALAGQTPPATTDTAATTAVEVPATQPASLPPTTALNPPTTALNPPTDTARQNGMVRLSSTPTVRSITTDFPIAPVFQDLGGFPWVLPLLSVLFVATMLGLCCSQHRGKLLKRRGWAFLKYFQVEQREEDCLGRHLHVQPSERSPLVETQGLLGSEPRDGSGPGSVQALQAATPQQQVTVEHPGGDSVNNTVGSIYIYSPRMVVLGTNTSDCREEEGPPQGEPWDLLITPQQESCVQPGGATPSEEVPAEPPVTVCVQEDGKELNYPVPATSK
ncbi:hypothetical protein MATL_G00080470 [Megalops atlanticus]|uniref:TNFR-Cys domain-containing protein n=1 Tax=Megalops atlanticus TaxID=7932 RepID=A0A9D3TFG8_MEGAT|nr:hypothetical protein MATL_G00080470 [Megalops atlanticus]